MKAKIPLIYTIIITLLLTACMNYSRKGGGKVSKKEKAPETLVKVSEGIDELFKSVDSIEELIGLSESEYQAIRFQKDKKGEKSQKGNEGSNGEQSGQGGQGQESEQGQDQSNKGDQREDIMTKDEEIFLKWREVDKKLEEIHTSWNQYEVESMDKGANQQKGEGLKKNLNDFTIAVASRKIKDIYDAGSRVHNALAVYFDLYKDEISGDLSRIKYSAYKAYLQAQEGNNEEADKLLAGTEEYTARIRKNLKEDKVKDLEKLSLSLTDMKMALSENNMELLKIKLDIIIENIMTLKD